MKDNSFTKVNELLQNSVNKEFHEILKIEIFTKVIETHPEDHTAAFFIEKAKRHIQNGIPANWAGVEEMTYK